jgi:uncharacterized protein (TIGR02246 family)
MKTLLFVGTIAGIGLLASPNQTSMNSGSVPAADSSAVVRNEISQLLDSAAGAWNRGDLDRFMEDYAPDTTTTFVGSKGILRGRAAIKQAYAPRFAPGGVRDSLSFENLEVDILAKDVVHAIAYYRLMRGDSTIARGPTSLVMRKIGGRWKIIHDHSS